MPDHSSRLTESAASLSMSRREILKQAGGVVAAATFMGSPSLARGGEGSVESAPGGSKRIVVAGGGIGGLACAYELVRRGHDVTVLEAAGRTGGHVRTVRDPLADGLYVD
ncbi:MAG TPA: FAD-dependent oxidoreductase, partial [Vicinamibacteria bacterium]